MTGLIVAIVLAMVSTVVLAVIEVSHLVSHRRTAVAVLSPDAVDEVDEHADIYGTWWPDDEPADVVPGGELTDVERIDWLVTVDRLRND